MTHLFSRHGDERKHVAAVCSYSARAVAIATPTPFVAKALAGGLIALSPVRAPRILLRPQYRCDKPPCIAAADDAKAQTKE